MKNVFEIFHIPLRLNRKPINFLGWPQVCVFIAFQSPPEHTEVASLSRASQLACREQHPATQRRAEYINRHSIVNSSACSGSCTNWNSHRECYACCCIHAYTRKRVWLRCTIGLDQFSRRLRFFTSTLLINYSCRAHNAHPLIYLTNAPICEKNEIYRIWCHSFIIYELTALIKLYFMSSVY